MKLKFYLYLLLLVLPGLFATGYMQAQSISIWDFDEKGGIYWLVEESQNHTDHIEMSGFHVSVILTYGIENGGLVLKYHLVFPMLRTIPNDTHASLAYDFNNRDFPEVLADSKPIIEIPVKFGLNGLLSIETQAGNLQMVHEIFPSVDKAVVVDKRIYKNVSEKELKIELITKTLK